MNLAYIPAAPTRSAIAFDFATSAANIFAGIWEAGAGAIHAENEALSWIVDLLGWPDSAGGTFVSGGTMGNLSALVTARDTIRERRGGTPDGGWLLACTSDAHSSILGAANALDVGVVEVEQDERGHLTAAALRPVLAENPNTFVVVASAGTTNAAARKAVIRRRCSTSAARTPATMIMVRSRPRPCSANHRLAHQGW